MANPTSAFGWQMPTSSDLVTDLPADFETFGQAVDTSLADLKGGTTGQILSKASGTDMDFTWITNDVGDITAVTAGTGLSGGGTSGAVTLSIDTATTVDLTTAQTLTNKTLTSPVLTTPSISTIDAKGDLLVGSADNTIARLAVGTNDYVLTADSTATNGVKWAAASSGGGMTLLSTTTLSGASTSITVSSNTYNELWVYGYGISPSAELDMIIRLNSNSGSTDYVNNSHWSQNGSGGTYYGKNNGIYLNSVGSGGWGSGLTDNTFVLRIADCNSTYRKIVNVISQYNQGASAPTVNNNTANCTTTTSAVASIQVAVPSGSINAGTVKVYGVK